MGTLKCCIEGCSNPGAYKISYSYPSLVEKFKIENPYPDAFLCDEHKNEFFKPQPLISMGCRTKELIHEN